MNRSSVAGSLRVAFASVLILSAACSAEDGPAATSEVSAAIETEEVLRIGGALADGPEAFGSITGLVADERGRIVMADGRNHELRVFDGDGAFLFAAGREGAGPGELRNPCCLAFAPDGTLWVRDVGNGRFNAYRLGDTAATYLRTVPLPQEIAHASNYHAPITFDDSARMIAVGIAPSGEQGALRRMRVMLDLGSDGVAPRVIGSLALVDPPNDSVGLSIVEQRVEGGFARHFFYQPYGPRLLTAHSPGGNWARAVSSVPRVERYAADGELLHSVAIDIAPVALSERERMVADSQMVFVRQAASGSLPFDTPETKPLLAGIEFDSEGRLWVERTVADGTPREADVFDRDGVHVARVRWPADVRLGLASHISDGLILGVARDEMDVEQVVMLRVPE